jgi:hypothetical protein
VLLEQRSCHGAHDGLVTRARDRPRRPRDPTRTARFAPRHSAYAGTVESWTMDVRGLTVLRPIGPTEWPIDRA